MGSGEAPSLPPSGSSSSSDIWKNRIITPTILAGIVGGGVGLVSKHRKVHGLSNISASYASNFAIVTGCYCGVREVIRVSRQADPDDLINSAVAGFSTGALLGRLQGGPVGAVRYSIMFAAVGTMVDYATIRLRPVISSFKESMSQKSDGWFKLPEWSPIQVLDEEALAKKQAQERERYGPTSYGNLTKEKS